MNEKDNNLAFTLERMYGLFSQVSGGKFTDAAFLTNHDMNRVMSQLKDDENHAKMAAGILLTMPGNPFIYYGEEIGMKGAKPDEQIREPMIWSNTGAIRGRRPGSRLSITAAIRCRAWNSRRKTRILCCPVTAR